MGYLGALSTVVALLDKVLTNSTWEEATASLCVMLNNCTRSSFALAAILSNTALMAKSKSASASNICKSVSSGRRRVLVIGKWCGCIVFLEKLVEKQSETHQ
jgi:hypothetical protein